MFHIYARRQLVCRFCLVQQIVNKFTDFITDIKVSIVSPNVKTKFCVLKWPDPYSWANIEDGTWAGLPEPDLNMQTRPSVRPDHTIDYIFRTNYEPILYSRCILARQPPIAPSASRASRDTGRYVVLAMDDSKPLRIRSFFLPPLTRGRRQRSGLP